jgi:hypothetical protein
MIVTRTDDKTPGQYAIALDGSILHVKDALGEWPPIVIGGEAAARRWAAGQWPEAMWSSPLDDNETARRRFKDLAAAKQAREAEALAQCEAAVRLSTEQLLLFTRLLAADLGASRGPIKAKSAGCRRALRDRSTTKETT